MRRSFLAICLTTTMLSFPVLAVDIDVNSAIRAATIYNDRATLTRSAKIDVPAGAHMLVVKGLPLNIFTDSLRVDGTSKAKVSFGAVSHKAVSSEDYIVPQEKELNDILQGLQDSKTAFEVEKQALRVGQVFLENIGKQAVLRENEDIAKIDLNPKSWSEAAEHLSVKTAENLKAGLSLDIKIRDIDEKIRKTTQDLNGLRTGQKRSYTVSIPIEADRDTSVSFELSYQIPNVGWRPVYDARLDTKTGGLELIQYGSVWQQTGEDWDGVKLTLSTAQPSRGASLPELSTHWVNIYKERPMMKVALSSAAGFSEMASNMAASPMADEMVMEAPEERVVVQSAQINTNGFVAEYEIVGPSDVKADGTQSKLLIGNFDIESRIQVQIKPEFDANKAYLVSIAKLKGEAPILPGQVSLFRDGAYIGKDQMQMLRQGDEKDLGFGIDDSVTVSRNTIRDESSEVGMIAKDNVLERQYITEIKNLHKKPFEIAVFEAIPTSQDERVRVELVKGATSPEYQSDIAQKKGVMGWVFTLPPQESKKIGLGWKVSWPKGEDISGL